MSIPRTPDLDIGEPRLSFSVPEYDVYERSPGWHITFLSVAIAMILYGFFTGNFLFVMIILITGIIFYAKQMRRPPTLAVDLTEEGLAIGTRFYEYEEFENFFFVEVAPEVFMLYIRQKSATRPALRLPIKAFEVPVIEVRENLREFVDEDLDDPREPLSDFVARKLKIH